MRRFTLSLTVSAAILLALTGCATSSTPTASTASTASAKTQTDSSQPIAASIDVKQSLVKLRGYVTGATNASKTGDFAKAKQEFKEFKEGWESLEQPLKAKSKDTYQTLEKEVEGLSENLLESAQPDQGKVVAKLAFLGETIDTYVKSSP